MFTGCLPEKKDIRDYKFKKEKVSAGYYPATFSLPIDEKIKNQGQVCSCVAHAMSTIMEYYCTKGEILSTNFFYGAQHELYHRNQQGMYMKDACNIARKYGDPLEMDCKGNDEVPNCYSIAAASLNNEDIMQTAYKYRILKFAKAKSTNEIKYALTHYGPVLASIRIYDDMSVKQDGLVRTAAQGSYGRHAVVIYGWNEQGFLFQNSWGDYWGNKGKGIYPYTLKVNEAYSIIDEDGEDILTPKRTKILDILYKIINFILNMITQKGV